MKDNNITVNDIKSIENSHQVDGVFSKTKSNLFKNLKEWYFEIKEREQFWKIYEYIGIKQWKKIVMSTAGKLLPRRPNNYYITIPNQQNIEQFEDWTKYNEKQHLLSFLYSIPWLVATIWLKSDFSLLFAALIIQNLYLIMLQRYNRWRIQKVKSRYNK